VCRNGSIVILVARSDNPSEPFCCLGSVQTLPHLTCCMPCSVSGCCVLNPRRCVWLRGRGTLGTGGIGVARRGRRGVCRWVYFLYVVDARCRAGGPRIASRISYFCGEYQHHHRRISSPKRRPRILGRRHAWVARRSVRTDFGGCVL
jgi:hypothetical protein